MTQLPHVNVDPGRLTILRRLVDSEVGTADDIHKALLEAESALDDPGAIEAAARHALERLSGALHECLLCGGRGSVGVGVTCGGCWGRGELHANGDQEDEHG